MARLLVALCLAFLAAAALADTAGQVMFAYGETHALRQGRIMQLHAGSSVESGDQLHTGVNGYLQIRFTDWGVMSLRPRTDFVIDQYQYEQSAGGVERAFFSLISGGVRSITGLIGHRNRSNYRMRTRTTAIGIRGTHYAVLICEQDCKLDDGSLGEDGVYGGVVEGRIAVSPYGGPALEREFGAGQYFRLASANSVPEPFSAPPPFFWDKREPQARGGGGTFAGITWKPKPGAPSEVASPVTDEVGGVAGSLLRTDGSLTLSPITAPVLNQVGAPVVNGVAVSTLPAAGTLISPLASDVVLPAAGLAGSIVNSVLTMPTLGQVAPLAGPVLNAVPVVVAPVVATVGGVVNTVVPVLPPVIVPPVALPPIAVPPVAVPPVAVPPVAVPPVAVPPVAVPPVAVPPVAVPPVAVPPVAVPPVAVPPVAVPPVAVPPVAVPPVAVPPVAVPPVAVPPVAVPPVTAPTPAPPTVITPAPPPVALPTLPSLPLSKGFVAPLKR